MIEELASAFKLSDQSGSFAIELTVLGSPDGDIPFVFTVADGKVDGVAGSKPDAEVVLTLPYKSATADLRPPVAYMQGLLKASGNMELFLAILKTAA